MHDDLRGAVTEQAEVNAAGGHADHGAGVSGAVSNGYSSRREYKRRRIAAYGIDKVGPGGGVGVSEELVGGFVEGTTNAAIATLDPLQSPSSRPATIRPTARPITTGVVV